MVDDTTEYMHCALETPSTGWSGDDRAVALKIRYFIDKEPPLR
jgi:hypothetical protein